MRGRGWVRFGYKEVLPNATLNQADAAYWLGVPQTLITGECAIFIDEIKIKKCGKTK